MTGFQDFFPIDAVETGSARLEVLKLSTESQIISLFTDESVCLKVHYVERDDFRGYVKCNTEIEGRCLLCDVGKMADSRIALPVYDVEADKVKALLVPGATGPHSLGPQLRREFDRDDSTRCFVSISRDYNKYTVASFPIPEETETGDSVIAEFIESAKRGRVSLKEVVPELSNRELLRDPLLARAVLARGLPRKDYELKSRTEQTGTND